MTEFTPPIAEVRVGVPPGVVSVQTGAETPAPETAPDTGAEVEAGEGVGVIISPETI